MICHQVGPSIVRLLPTYEHFTVRTDHQPLETLVLKNNISNGKLQTWGLNISAYVCEVKYFNRRQNTAANTLSCQATDFHNQKEEGVDNVSCQLNRPLEVGAVNSSEFNPATF